MASEIVIQAQPRAWLEDSVLQAYVGTYGEHLDRGRYATNTQRVYLCCVAHFASWLTRARTPLVAVDAAVTARFVSEHLPLCDCPYPVRRVPHDVKAALNLLLDVLKTEGAIAGPIALDTPVTGELARFDAYMRDARGLALSTRQQRYRMAGQFLIGQFGHGPILIQNLTPAAIRRFVLDGGAKVSAGTIRVRGGTIGGYLRFRAMGGDRVTGLLAAIPRAAHWRLASLPEVLSDTEVDTLLRSFEQPFRSHLRAFAMVRCLTDLGLRCSEVANLRLEDIDWSQGTVRLVGTKTRRVDTLPLPAATGSAIAAYLRDERPRTSNRAIFVRHVAPYDEPVDKSVVQRAVRAAYKRCGWTRTRVHILRHSVASRLLRAGTPMKEIADILRHRSLDTSAIYTKVDLNRLAAVALPWPGSAS